MDERTIGAAEHHETCGCVSDNASGLPLRTCATHDKSAPWMKAGRELEKAGVALDGYARIKDADHYLLTAARHLVEAGKALLS